jgi:hypothetical protein
MFGLVKKLVPMLLPFSTIFALFILMYWMSSPGIIWLSTKYFLHASTEGKKLAWIRHSRAQSQLCLRLVRTSMQCTWCRALYIMHRHMCFEVGLWSVYMNVIFSVGFNSCIWHRTKDRKNPNFCAVSDAAVTSDTENHGSCKQTINVPQVTNVTLVTLS